MNLNPFVAGIGPMIVAFAVACCAVLGVPIYFWIADKRRRGAPVRWRGLTLPILIGSVGIAALLMLLFARG